MNKKILTITILALAFCMSIAFAKPVMATECNDEGCTEGCEKGENCTAECCPVTIGEKCYPTLESAVSAATNHDTIELRGNVSVSKMVDIKEKENVTLDLAGYTITSDDNFTGSDDSSNNDKHVINISSKGVTVKNGKIVTTSKNKHGINVYGVEDVTLQDLTIDHRESLGGAPLVVNGSTVKVEGNLDLKLGEKSWYGINVDPKKQDSNKASLTFENDSVVAVEGNKDQLFMYMEDVSDNKSSEFILNGDTGVAISDGKGNTTYYVGLTDEEVVEKAETGSTITVTKGNLELENLPDNVTVKVEEGATATVDGYEVTESGVDTSVLNKLKELEELTKNLKEELKNQGLTQEEIAERLKAAEQLIKDQNGTIAELQEQIANLQKQYDELKGKDEQDETPGTGTVDVALITTVVAMISVAGIVTVKKYSK